MSQIYLRGRVIDGTGGPVIEDGVVVVSGNRIQKVCDARELTPPPFVKVIEITDGTILPGFIDCHCHLTSIGMNTMMTYVRHNYDKLIESVRDAKNLLYAGFTAARDIGVFGPHLKKAIVGGVIEGPRLHVSGRMLSTTSGHGDMYPFPVDFAERQNTVALLMDGPEECYKGVRTMFREGAEFIKICSTGGIMSEGDGSESSEFAPEELRVIVEEARRHHTYVASHAQGTRGIKDALKAGVTCIEHGIFLDEECIELMQQMDATLDPTISIIRIIAANPGDVPPYAYEKAQKAVEAHIKSMEMARKAGLRITLGSDFLGGDSDLITYGKNGLEFVNLVKYGGLTPMEAIVAGTKNGAYLMQMEDEIGTLEAGKLADLVMVRGNPLERIELLADPDQVRVVMQDGKLIKHCEDLI